MTMQYRIAVEGGVRDIDESKREVLVSFPWETIDSYKTDFSRDCFDDYLNRQLPVMCWQHQRTEPIGRVREWQKTDRANEMVAGFSDFNAVPRALQAFAQLRDKEITDFSYGFSRAEHIKHPEVRGAIRFTKAAMPEISPVTVGSIPGAVAIGIRAEAEVANIRGLIDAGAISEEEGAEMLRAAGVDTPALLEAVIDHREVITVSREELAELVREQVAAQITPEIDPTPEDALAECLERAGEAAAAGDWLSLRDELDAAAVFAEDLADPASDERGDGNDDEDDDDEDDNSRGAVSDKPWSEFSASDYSDEQYAKACLISGDGTAKGDNKLPIREPDGTLNRNGVHAAASALAGGRGGVDAPMAEKAAAARKLVGIYKNQLNETPPESLVKLAEGSREEDDLDLRAAEAETLARINSRLAG